MSLLHRLLSTHPERARAAPAGERRRASRFDFPRGPFAELVTTPPEIADVAYAAYMRHELTRGVAEREVELMLTGATFACPSIEALAAYRFELGRERTDTGRRRLFARYLVRLQYVYEANQRTLHALRRTPGARRVMVLPGCCAVCDRLARREHRVSHPPQLPVAGCLRHGGCICGYVPVVE